MSSDDQRKSDAEKTIASILAIARVYGGEVALLARRLGLDPLAVPRAAGTVWARTLRPQLDRLATPALAPLLRRIGDQLAVLIAEIAMSAAATSTGSRSNEPSRDPSSAAKSTPTSPTDHFGAASHADDSADEIMKLVREATERAQRSLDEEPDYDRAHARDHAADRAPDRAPDHAATGTAVAPDATAPARDATELGPDVEPNTARIVADAVGRELKAERLSERIHATRRRIEETQSRIARAEAALARRRERRARMVAQLQFMGQAIARLENKTDALMPAAEPAKVEPRGAGVIPSGPRRGPARVIEHPAARRNGRRSSES